MGGRGRIFTPPLGVSAHLSAHQAPRRSAPRPKIQAASVEIFVDPFLALLRGVSAHPLTGRILPPPPGPLTFPLTLLPSLRVDPKFSRLQKKYCLHTPTFVDSRNNKNGSATQRTQRNTLQENKGGQKTNSSSLSSNSRHLSRSWHLPPHSEMTSCCVCVWSTVYSA